MGKFNMDKYRFSHIEDLAKQIKLSATWKDLNLSEETITQLRKICSHFKYSKSMSREWGVRGNSLRLNGLIVIFSGPPGTDKTMAAQVIANDLGLDLYKIDLSTVVSKYIGETEKNLNRIFAAAEEDSSILFFDVADALFGKRTEVNDAHDRYANVEVSYLLQKLEGYEGIAVLTSNLKNNLDPAFIRRVAYVIEFQ